MARTKQDIECVDNSNMDIGHWLRDCIELARSLTARRQRQLSPFYEVGFHGDAYLIEIAHHLLGKSSCFIETGANVGSTLAYVARNFPRVHCLSCEPDLQAYQVAGANVASFPNVELFNETSQQFIDRLNLRKQIFDRQCVFWLDAHGFGFEWPLRAEIEFITHRFESGYILIDDFLVPGQNQFKYDEYKGQTCSFEFIKNAIKENLQYVLYYPNYVDRTSPHHPLTGWGLIAFGECRGTQFPASLEDKIVQAV
jgi:hypothetical protein